MKRSLLSLALGVSRLQAQQLPQADLTKPKPDSWPTFNGDYSGRRYSPLKQIDASNASRLGLSWLYEIGPGGGNQEGTLLMSNGTLYGITNWSIVYAVDARTGKEKWRWDPEVNHAAVQPKICCGVVNRGIAIYEGNIIAPVIDANLLRFDTGGKRVKKRDGGEAIPGTSPPLPRQRVHPYAARTFYSFKRTRGLVLLRCGNTPRVGLFLKSRWRSPCSISTRC